MMQLYLLHQLDLEPLQRLQSLVQNQSIHKWRRKFRSLLLFVLHFPDQRYSLRRSTLQNYYRWSLKQLHLPHRLDQKIQL